MPCCLCLPCPSTPSLPCTAIALTLLVGGAFAALVFGSLRHFNLLRVDQMTELAGIDNIDHGGPAYPEFNMVPLNGTGPPHGGSQ